MKLLVSPPRFGATIAAAAVGLAVALTHAAHAQVAAPTPALTEHAWALRETVADIDEMARYGSKRPPAEGLTQSIAPWQPQLLVAYAASQLTAVAAKPNDTDPPDQYRALTELSADVFVKANVLVSGALTRNMQNPRAHESAALVLGAFGLRENAGGLSDVRWVMNRMTAHLAVAAALRGSSSAVSDDGRLAHAALLALSNRRRAAGDALAAVNPAGKDPAFAAWQRALRIRVTDDWRLLAEPARASRLEKLQYFRARRFTVRSQRAGQELADLREPAAVDFGRIALSFSPEVDDGNDVIVPALDAELEELALVHRLMRQKPLPEALPAAVINARAGRLLSDGDPQVLPWGAWAEFAQRHLGLAISEIDRHYRRMLGMPERADQWKALVDLRFSHLTLFPVAASARMVGSNGQADLRFLERAVDVSINTPELVTFDFWEWLEPTAQRNRVRGMPRTQAWFAWPSAAVPYDGARRLQSTIGGMPLPVLEALIDEAPTDRNLLGRALTRRQDPALIKKVIELLQPRVDYDLWAIDQTVSMSSDRAVWLPLLRKACTLSVGECLRLAYNLRETDEAAAAAEYERAFRDPGLDRVSMANASGWLVSYYERNGQLPKALDLAQGSADVGSARGIYTLARYFERRGRVEEARELLVRIEERYPQRRDDDWLAAFYYRQAVIAKRPEYQDRWLAASREIFPNGLQLASATMPVQPAVGVLVERDSQDSRRANLRARDIIVAVDGFIVENERQFRTVLAFSHPEELHELTAWRSSLFTVKLLTNHGMTLADYTVRR